MDLPEIPEDEDSEDEVVKDSWGNTPTLLVQEKMDPASVFGPPTAQKPWLVRLRYVFIRDRLFDVANTVP